LGNLPTTLTSLGAQELYASGNFFRNRYVTSAGSNAVDSAPLYGLSANSIDPEQLYVMALDEQFCVASAQAFVQGFYPPYTLNSSMATVLDPTSMLANGSYVDYPLNGYQYPQIHVVGAEDMEFPYLGGSMDCPAFDIAAETAMSTPEYVVHGQVLRDC
jgi:hypothetical protein